MQRSATDSGAGSAVPQPERVPAEAVSVTIATPLIDAVLQKSRLDALSACDANVAQYDPSSFLMIFRVRGRQMTFVTKPLLCLLAWGVMWALIFERVERVRGAIQPLGDLITPLLTPVSFLLVFRLGRAAVRFWDARSAAG